MIRTVAALTLIFWCALIFVDMRKLVDMSNDYDASEMEHILFDVAEQTAKKYAITGGYVGIINGDRLTSKAVGFANLESQIRVEDNVAFNVGSISKPLTVWGVLALAQDGLVDLDAPVSQYLTQWTLPQSDFDPNDVTIRRVLWHTGGLNIHGYAGYETLDGPITQPFRPTKFAPSSLAEASRTNYPIRVTHAPGAKRSYSGGGFAILQMLIEDVSGIAFADYMRVRIFDPMGMSGSGFAPEKLSEAASAYNIQGKRLPDMRFLALAPAGLYISGEDLGVFLRAHVLGEAKALAPEYLAMALTPTDADPRFAMSYTRHPFEKGILYGHGGNNSSWHAQIYFIPETEQGFYFLTNSTTGAQWEIDLSCAWKSWALAKSPHSVCAAPMQVIQNISIAAAMIGALAILIAARAAYRLRRGSAQFLGLPKSTSLSGMALRYLQIVIVAIVGAASLIVFFTSTIYWRQGVTFFDEIPIYEVRYLVTAICALLCTAFFNVWLTAKAPQ